MNFPANEKNVRVIGRSLFYDGIRYLNWSGSAVEFSFSGTEISAEIWTDWTLDEPWKEIFRPWFAVCVNGKMTSRFPLDEGTKSYTIFKSEAAETVTVRIVKLSESAFSKAGIAGISADGTIAPTIPLPRRIEFVGDSITCGFGIEAKSAEEGFSTATENPYINYAVKTADCLGAEYSLVSWTSIGVYSSSTDTDEISDGWVMPMLYDYTDLAVEGQLGISEHIPYDFSGYAPQVVVINLGTNDYTYTKDIPERTEAFRKAYLAFLGHVREKNPDAYIICALGMMGAELFPAVESAVKEISDSRIFALEFDVQREEDGIGAEKHPNSVTHRKAARKLAEKISEITGWDCDLSLL